MAAVLPPSQHSVHETMMIPITSPSATTETSFDRTMSDAPPSSPWNPADSGQTSSGQSRPRGSSGGIPNRRRKVPDSITPNACTNCKQARAKCDGARPACQRCVGRDIIQQCHYELHAKSAKEQMIREIQRLQLKTEHLEEENDLLEEKNSWIETIMDSLASDGSGTEIISRLKRGQSHEAIALWLGRPFAGKAQALSPVTEKNITQAIEQYHRDLVENHDPRYWTNVTADPVLIQHLITLYLTWIHPVHMLFDVGHFMESFRNCVDVYCSSAMVSVMCAMSCCLLHNTWDNDEETRGAIDSLRNQFMDETRAQLKDANPSKMTSIQAYAILFLVELASGHALIASSHLRLATESLIARQNSEQSRESEEVAAWGILTLHTAWSGFTYQKPSAPISTHAHPFVDTDKNKAEPAWRLYRQPGDDEDGIPERPSHALMTASEHAKLYRIIHETILVYCGSRGRVSAHALLGLYERYMDWKHSLPPSIAGLDDEPLPHVLFLHIQYHAAMIHLLHPLLHLDQYYQETYEQLRSLVVQHAKAGLGLLAQYQNLYSDHYISPLHVFCMVHICDAILRYDDQSTTTTDTMRFCLTSLQTSKVGYPVAGSLQKMFRLSLGEYNIAIPEELEQLISSSARLGPDDLLDACTRATYKQPMAQILPNMEADLGQHFMDEWHNAFKDQPPGSLHGPAAGKQKAMDIDSILNN